RRAVDLEEEIGVVDPPLVVERALRAALEEVELEIDLRLPAKTDRGARGVALAPRPRAVEDGVEANAPHEVEGDAELPREHVDVEAREDGEREDAEHRALGGAVVAVDHALVEGAGARLVAGPRLVRAHRERGEVAEAEEAEVDAAREERSLVLPEDVAEDVAAHVRPVGADAEAGREPLARGAVPIVFVGVLRARGRREAREEDDGEEGGEPHRANLRRWV